MVSGRTPEGSGMPGPASGAAGRYPDELQKDVTTTDGTVIHLRPIRPDDGPGLLEFHRGLSFRSVYLRFFSAHAKLSEAEVERFTHVDYVNRLAIVAEHGGALIAVGRWDRLGGTDEAEVAFVVADEFQHHGIGTLLLEELAEAAWQRGIRIFCADTLTENRTMLNVFSDSGFAVTTHRDGDTVHVRFPIEPDSSYMQARSARHDPAHRDPGDPGAGRTSGDAS